MRHWAILARCLSRAQDPAPRIEGGFRKWIQAAVPAAGRRACRSAGESQVCRQTKALSRDVGNLLALMTRPGDQDRGVGEVAEQAAAVLARLGPVQQDGTRRDSDTDQVLKRHVQELGNPKHGLGDAFAELGSGMMQNPKLAGALRERVRRWLTGS